MSCPGLQGNQGSIGDRTGPISCFFCDCFFLFFFFLFSRKPSIIGKRRVSSGSKFWYFAVLLLISTSLLTILQSDWPTAGEIVQRNAISPVRFPPVRRPWATKRKEKKNNQQRQQPSESRYCRQFSTASSIGILLIIATFCSMRQPGSLGNCVPKDW